MPTQPFDIDALSRAGYTALSPEGKNALKRWARETSRRAFFENRADTPRIRDVESMARAVMARLLQVHPGPAAIETIAALNDSGLEVLCELALDVLCVGRGQVKCATCGARVSRSGENWQLYSVFGDEYARIQAGAVDTTDWPIVHRRCP